MQNQKLAWLLQKVEAEQANTYQEDALISINEEMSRNIRSAYGGNNGNCSNNDSCFHNSACINNDSCRGNNTCKGNGSCNAIC